MPENEFEKKVFSEMQGLKISPSDEVWPKVEARISRKKRRRFIVIIFLLAGVGLFGYWQRDFLLGVNQNDIAEKSGPIMTNLPADEKNNTKKAGNEDGGGLIENAINSSHPERGSHSPGIKEEKVFESSSERQVEKYRNTVPVFSNNKKNTLPVQIKKEKQESEIREITGDIETTDLPQAKSNSSIKDENMADSVISEKKINVSEPERPEEKEKVLTQPTVNDSTLRVTKKPAVSKKWKTGFFIAPGISSMNKNPIDFNLGKSIEFLSSPNAGTGGGPSPAPPSASKPGFAFQAGFFLQTSISKRSHIAAGLQLGYYSDRIHVGGKRDTLLPNAQYSQLSDANLAYAARNPSGNYTNRYWFAELPLTYQWRISKKTDRPVYIFVSTTISRLITTNALVYDTAFGGIYHNSRNYFNKTQFSLSAGTDWIFYQNKKHHWSAGPVLDFHLNPLLSNPYEKNKYLLFSGIRARLILNSPKN